MYQNRFRQPQTPLGELTALPQTPSWIKGGLRKGRGYGKGGVGEEREGNTGKGRGRGGRGGKGTGREGTPNILFHPPVPVF